MGKKIFVSYKYEDSNVLALAGYYPTTVRSYVDELEKLLEKEDHIYKGEHDGEDLGSLVDATIGSKIGDKIFDSTVTIVLISKNMKENTPEKDQWIPWEISYSLREQSREQGNSKTNAVLAVVIPDQFGSYDYYITDNVECNSRTLDTSVLFQILSDSMFNMNDRESNTRNCGGRKIYEGSPHYIESAKWRDFISNINWYINRVLDIRSHINEYTLTKNVK